MKRFPNFRYFSLSGVALLLLAGLLHEKPFQVTPVFYGHVMRTSEGETVVEPGSPNGLSMSGDWIVLEAGTWKIPNCPKHGLGLDILVDNLPEGVTEVKMVIDFPPMTLPSGEVNSHLERTQPLVMIEEDAGLLDFYYFWDESYERGLGKWRFRLYHEDKLLFDEAFEVVACEDDAV